jgi:Spy/CpxP family protein refolding chaperone
MTNTDLFAKGLKVLKEIEDALTDEQWTQLQAILSQAREQLPEEQQEALAEVAQELGELSLDDVTESYQRDL